MSPLDPGFVMVDLLIIAGILALVDFTERTDITLPKGYTVPFALSLVGASYYFFATQGVSAIMSAIASGIFIGTIMTLYDRFIKRKDNS